MDNIKDERVRTDISYITHRDIETNKLNKSNSDIKSINENISNKYTDINYSFNKIKKINTKFIPDTAIVVDLSNNEIEDIEDGELNVLTLNLSDNYLINLNIDSPYITELSISNNMLENLDWLKKLPNLKKLRCSGNNITEIPEDMPNLEMLNLSDNCITKVDKLPHTLNELYISCNKITEFNTYLQDLYVLDISMNMLGEFNFSNVRNIKHIDISYNNLCGIDNISPTLTTLRVTNNVLRKFVCEHKLELLDVRGNQHLPKISRTYANNIIESEESEQSEEDTLDTHSKKLFTVDTSNNRGVKEVKKQETIFHGHKNIDNQQRRFGTLSKPSYSSKYTGSSNWNPYGYNNHITYKNLSDIPYKTRDIINPFYIPLDTVITL